jgi:hypothetical protein
MGWEMWVLEGGIRVLRAAIPTSGAKLKQDLVVGMERIVSGGHKGKRRRR